MDQLLDSETASDRWSLQAQPPTPASDTTRMQEDPNEASPAHANSSAVLEPASPARETDMTPAQKIAREYHLRPRHQLRPPTRLPFTGGRLTFKHARPKRKTPKPSTIIPAIVESTLALQPLEREELITLLTEPVKRWSPKENRFVRGVLRSLRRAVKGRVGFGEVARGDELDVMEM